MKRIIKAVAVMALGMMLSGCVVTPPYHAVAVYPGAGYYSPGYYGYHHYAPCYYGYGFHGGRQDIYRVRCRR